MKAWKWIRRLLILLCLGIVLFSGAKLYEIYKVYDTGNDSYEDLTDRYVAAAPQAMPEQTEGTEPTETLEPAETAPVSVDFDALLAENADVVGWLYCADTPINYPLVRSEDNDYYLYRLLDGTSNANGSIFMDYRNSPDFSDWNSIFYGHNMQSGAMFGTLQRYRQQTYFEKHPVMYLLTPQQDYKVVLISGYTTWDTASETYGFPETLEERNVLVENALDRSTFKAGVTVLDTDRLLTLSTCAYEFENARYVLVGVLRPLGEAERET